MRVVNLSKSVFDAKQKTENFRKYEILEKDCENRRINCRVETNFHVSHNQSHVKNHI